MPEHEPAGPRTETGRSPCLCKASFSLAKASLPITASSAALSTRPCPAPVLTPAKMLIDRVALGLVRTIKVRFNAPCPWLTTKLFLASVGWFTTKLVLPSAA